MVKIPYTQANFFKKFMYFYTDQLMNNMITGVAQKMTKEEYIAFELKAERRHEFIKGQIFEMPGELDLNNLIAGKLYVLLAYLLEQKGYWVFAHDVKVAIPGEEKFYYPDVFVTNEPRTEENKYIKTAPVLIAEILSPSSRITDTVDKYLDYTKIPALKYYLVVEPETIHITLYHQNEGGQWQAEVFTQKDQIIDLPLLQMQIPLSAVYAIPGF
jgi:Uma2 family endonuclease